MAIAANVELIATQSWPQGDARDPLGIWGIRELITGDASGDSVKVTIQTPAGQDAAYVYNCLAVNIAITNVVQVASTFIKCRLLSNWPNVDQAAGVNAFSTLRIAGVAGSADFTNPLAGEAANGASLIKSNDRFILMYDPRPTAGQLDIVELEISTQVLNTVYAFEAYGHFWDRAVMDTPGGPRHP